MDKEFLARLGINEDMSSEILKRYESDVGTLREELDNHYKAEISLLKTDHAIERALATAGARNLKAARALITIDDTDDPEEVTKSLESQIKELVLNEGTSFLFGSTYDNHFIGVQPAEKGDNRADINAMSYSEFISTQN